MPGSTRRMSTSGASESSRPPVACDVAVIGAGAAAKTLVAAVAGNNLDVVVFEADRVGGVCPFLACIPSKGLLHDGTHDRSWIDAVDRRDEIVDHLDDGDHATAIERHGARLVRARCRFVAKNLVEADGQRYHPGAVVIATGAEPIIPGIEGLPQLGKRLWASDDALTTAERPTRLAIMGGGPIGCELAQIYADFGTEVYLIDTNERAFPDLTEAIGAIVDDGLKAAGVHVRRGREIARFELRGDHALCHLDDGTAIEADRVVAAIGRRPRTDCLGLEHLDLDPSEPLPLSSAGRVECPGSVWAIGDVAGRGQYTHLANHQARVVADHLVGSGDRRFDDVVTPACVFTRPPLIMVGPSPAEAGADVVWVDAELADVARWTTDELGNGHLTMGVDPSTRTVVAAHGAGARFDELAATFVTMIDAKTPLDRLARSMMPFPTVSELVAVLVSRAIRALDS